MVHLYIETMVIIEHLSLISTLTVYIPYKNSVASRGGGARGVLLLPEHPMAKIIWEGVKGVITGQYFDMLSHDGIKKHL